jgi:hypothetical protein
LNDYVVWSTAILTVEQANILPGQPSWLISSLHLVDGTFVKEEQQGTD